MLYYYYYCHDPTQTYQDIVRLRHARFCFWGRHTTKTPIKVWITPYKPNISPKLCRCGIRLRCYIPPTHSTSLLRFAPPSIKRTRRATLIPSVMTQPKLGKILLALGLNKDRVVLFLRCLYTSKRVLSIEMLFTPYKPNISFVLCRCGFA